MHVIMFFVMRRRPPRSTRADTLSPYPARSRSGLPLAGELAQLRSDLVCGACQLGVTLGALLATGRYELRTIGRVGVDQLLLLCNLSLVGRDQLFLLQLGADALGNLRHGLGLAFARGTVTRRAGHDKLGEGKHHGSSIVRRGLTNL